MQGWVIIAIVAIAVWGVLRFNRDHNANRNQNDSADRQALQEAERERDELRQRVQVLERIVTDANTPESRKIKEISEEIENLRDN